MGHHTQHITLFIDDACYVIQRSIGVGLLCYLSIFRTISEDYLFVGFQLSQRLSIGIIAALTM